MAQLGEAISRYHKLVEQNGFGDLAWADQLQERMRQQHLTDSGRLLSPVLRPHFLSRRQADNLTHCAEQFADVIEQLERLALSSPRLLSRLQMLPAEKMLAAVQTSSSRISVACSVDAHIGNSSVCLRGVEACKPAGLMYSNLLADLFLELPVVKEFKRGRYKVSKLGGPKLLLQAVLETWREFGGKSKPNVAVLEFASPPGSAATEGYLLTEYFLGQGLNARLLSPEQLAFAEGRLKSGDFQIDVVFRRILTRELLIRWDLSHPLLQAYRDNAVCVVNNFRSEIGQRRALFDLLTDETIMPYLSATNRKFIRAAVPWTRFVSARKTKHLDQDVDLPEYILRNREQLVLLPNEDLSENQAYIGAAMTPSAWDRAVRLSLRTPYVVQERPGQAQESFPFFQYSELKMRDADVALQPQLLNGRMSGASAVLNTLLAGSVTQLAVVPVLVLEEEQ